MVTEARTPAFVHQYRTAMREFVATILAYRPDMVLAIARKGPRLIELCEQFGVSGGFVPLISEKTIPFLDRTALRGKRVAVCDDIAIYGSSLKDVADQLHDAGADTIEMTMAIDRQWLNRGLVDPIHQLDLTTEQVQPFNRSLVRAFQVLGKPYDVDHPILTVPGMLTAKQEYIRTAEKMGLKVFDLTSPLHEAFGLVNITIDDPYSGDGESILNPACVSTDQGIRKIRLIADLHSGRVRFVPITTFSLDVGALKAGEELFHPEARDLNSIFQNLTSSLLASHWPTDTIDKAIYRLAIYLSAYAYATVLLRSSSQLLGFKSSRGDEIQVESRDLDILFGRDVGMRLAGELSRVDWGTASDLVGREHPNAFTGHNMMMAKPATVAEHSAKVDEGLLDRVKDHIPRALKPRQDLVTNLNSIFRQLYLHLDLEQRQQRVYEPSRLSVGFTFGFVKEILRSGGIRFQDWQLSACIDYSVDCGSIVPIVVSPAAGVCTRAYRFGESQFSIGPDELRYTSAVLTEHLCDVYGRLFNLPLPSVPRTVFEKTFAFVAGRLDRVGSPEFSDINLELAFHRHGARLRVASKMEETWFAEWCNTNSIVKSRGETSCEFNPAFFEEYRREDNPVPRWFIADLKSLITLLVKIAKNRKDPSHAYETLLAITTCNSERNTIRAVRADLQLWFTDRSTSGRAFLGALAEVLQEAQKDPTAFEADLMRTQARFKSLVARAKAKSQALVDLSGECRHKFSVFSRIALIHDELDAMFTKPSDLAEALGDQYERFFFDVFDTTPYPGNDELRQRLQRLVELCDAFGRIGRSFVDDELQGGVRRGQRQSLRNALTSFDVQRQQFVEAEPLFPLSTFGKEIRESETRLARLSSLCRQGTQVLNQLENTYELLCAEPRVPLMKPSARDECVVLYDIAGSSQIFSKEQSSGKKLALKNDVHSYCRDVLKERAADAKPDTEDSGGYVLRSLPNSVRLAAFLRNRAQDLGFAIRVGLYWTRGRERLYESARDGTKGGAPFEVAARLSTYLKDQQKEERGQSYMFTNEELIEDLRRGGDDLSQSFHFERLGKLSPRGSGLPEVTVYRITDH